MILILKDEGERKGGRSFSRDETKSANWDKSLERKPFFSQPGTLGKYQIMLWIAYECIARKNGTVQEIVKQLEINPPRDRVNIQSGLD